MNTTLLSACQRALALLLVAGSSGALACPEQVPAGLDASTVAQDVMVDGLRLSMLEVKGKEQAATLLARLEREWSAGGYQVKRNQAAGWDILAALSERCLTTLQLAESRPASGYFAVNRPKPGAPATPRGAIATPADARLLGTVSSNDDGRKGSTAALTSRLSLEDACAFFMRSLSADAWGAVRAEQLADAHQVIQGVQVSAQKGHARVEVMLWRDGLTHIVINVAEAL